MDAYDKLRELDLLYEQMAEAEDDALEADKRFESCVEFLEEAMRRHGVWYPQLRASRKERGRPV